MDARVVLPGLLISIGVVVAYHLVVSSGTTGPVDSGPGSEVARLAARLQALEDAPGAEPSLGRHAVEDRLTRIEQRLAGLELRERSSSAGPVSAAPGDLPEDAVSREGGVLEAARAEAHRANLERSASRYRDRIRRLEPEAAENDLAAAASLLAEYVLALRELHRETSDATPARREADLRREEELRRELRGRLASHLSAEAVADLTRTSQQNR